MVIFYLCYTKNRYLKFGAIQSNEEKHNVSKHTRRKVEDRYVDKPGRLPTSIWRIYEQSAGQDFYMCTAKAGTETTLTNLCVAADKVKSLGEL